MKFVRELPEKKKYRPSKYADLIGVENIEIIRRNPSKWALVAEGRSKAEQSGFHAWGRRNDLETATRNSSRKPGGVDFYVRYQPKPRAKGEDW